MKSKSVLLICLSITLCLSIFIVGGCSDDSNNPANSSPGGNISIDISGITRTAADETVLENDADDWCYSNDKETPIPNAYALYPAYPNPSHQQVILRYDVPLAGEVKLSIVDSTGAVVRNILNEARPAGGYSTFWDRKDNSGQNIESGIFRLLMTAGDFECYGDIQLKTIPNDLNPVRFTTTVSGNSLTVNYSSDIAMGGLFIIFAYDGDIISIDYGPDTNGMLKQSLDTGQTLRVIFVPGLSGSKSLPTLPDGSHKLCTIYFNGAIGLAYADASDALGESVIRTDIENVVE